MSVSGVHVRFAAAVFVLALAGSAGAARASTAPERAGAEGSASDSLSIDLGEATLELVLVRAGPFEQGSPRSERGRGDDEGPRTVALSHDYYIGKYEVTRPGRMVSVATSTERRADETLAAMLMVRSHENHLIPALEPSLPRGNVALLARGDGQRRDRLERSTAERAFVHANRSNSTSQPRGPWAGLFRSGGGPSRTEGA